MTDPVPSKDLVSQLRGLTAGARLLGYTAAEHIERLEIALRGIQSCSTCEACRGAATLALNGATPEPLLTYETFWQRVREAGWNPSPEELRRLLAAQKKREAGTRVPSTDLPPEGAPR